MRIFRRNKQKKKKRVKIKLIFRRKKRTKKRRIKLRRVFRRRKRTQKKPVKISIKTRNKTALMTISGDFNNSTTPYLQKVCKKVITNKEVEKVVLDFKNVRKIDTSAFACILNFMKEYIREEKDICATNVSKLKKDYLKMLKLDKTIRIVRKPKDLR